MAKAKHKNKRKSKRGEGSGPLDILTGTAAFRSEAGKADPDRKGIGAVRIKKHLRPKGKPHYKSNGKLKTDYYEEQIVRLQECRPIFFNTLDPIEGT